MLTAKRSVQPCSPNNPRDIRFYDNLIMLIFEHCLCFGSITLIKLSDGKRHSIVSPKYTGLLKRKFISDANQPICPPISVSMLATKSP